MTVQRKHSRCAPWLRPAIAIGLTLFTASARARTSDDSDEDAGSATGITAQILACGRIETTPEMGKKDAPEAAHGFVYVMDPAATPQFTGDCHHLAVWHGAEFGVSVRADGLRHGDIIPLRTRVTHPPFLNHRAGKTETVDEWDSPMNSGVPRFAGWLFDEPWNLVAGKWKFEILSGDSVIAGADVELEVVEKPQ